jgi:hypothetical protein
VPLIVIVLPAHAAVTPAGKPVAAPMPVAPVVVWVMAVRGVLIQSVGDDEAALTVLLALTMAKAVLGRPGTNFPHASWADDKV